MRRRWILVLGGGAIVAAVGVLWFLHNQRVTVAAHRPTVQAAPIASEVTLPATILAKHVVAVPAPVEGMLESVYAEIGQQVYEGELLGRISNALLSAAQERAEAAVESARERASTLQSAFLSMRLEASRARSDATRARSAFERADKAYQRQRMLHAEGATPRLVYEKSQQEFELAKIEYESLEKLASQAEERTAAVQVEIGRARALADQKAQELEDARQAAASAEVHSPVTGVVVGRAKQAGEEVPPDVADLFRIGTNLTALEALVSADPKILSRVRPGQEAAVITAETPDEAITGRVLEIRNGQIVVEFTSPTQALLPGGTAHVRIKLT